MFYAFIKVWYKIWYTRDVILISGERINDLIVCSRLSIRKNKIKLGLSACHEK